MTNVMEFSLVDLQVFLLVLFRVTGLVMFAPILGSDVIPPLVKIFLSLLLAMIFFPFVGRTGLEVQSHLGFYLVAVVLEFSLGAIIGFCATLIFTAVQFGGEIIGQEIGISMANVIDPISNQQASVVGQFKAILASLIYLGIDGHHSLIKACSSSFQSVPLLGFSMNERLGMRIVDGAGTSLFIDAIRIAAPAMVTLLLVTVAMAFLARIVPEMNIFILGFSLRIIVGFALLWLAMPLFGKLVVKIQASSGALLEDILRLVKTG